MILRENLPPEFGVFGPAGSAVAHFSRLRDVLTWLVVWTYNILSFMVSYRDLSAGLAAFIARPPSLYCAGQRGFAEVRRRWLYCISPRYFPMVAEETPPCVAAMSRIGPC